VFYKRKLNLQNGIFVSYIAKETEEVPRKSWYSRDEYTSSSILGVTAMTNEVMNALNY